MAMLCGVCRQPVTASNRSTENSGYCSDCGTLVYAFRPNSALPNDWFLVVDPGRPGGPVPEEGSVVSGGQCEACALNEFTISKVARRTWEAICRGQVADGTYVSGCGTSHPVRMKMRCKVIFPWSALESD